MRFPKRHLSFFDFSSRISKEVEASKRESGANQDDLQGEASQEYPRESEDREHQTWVAETSRSSQ